jgi:hypothetical protein
MDNKIQRALQAGAHQTQEAAKELKATFLGRIWSASPPSSASRVATQQPQMNGGGRVSTKESATER